jgi:hypothetical protein
MFCVARAYEGFLVLSAVYAPGERAGKKGALIVSSASKASRMQRHWHDDVYFAESKLGAHCAFKQVYKVVT